MELWFLLFSLILSIIGSFFRFYFPLKYNKFIVSFLSLLLLETSFLLLGPFNLQWLLFLFIFIMSSSFFVVGGILSAIISVAILFFQVPIDLSDKIFTSFAYFALGIGLGIYCGYVHKETILNSRWQNQLFKQSKELSIVREISVALQSTLELDKLLHIILSALTAGYGLGYNRALLFLVSTDKKRLEGKFGIGPMNELDGYSVWEDVVASKLNLKDFISLKEESLLFDHQLNDLVQKLKISLDNNQNIFTRCIKNQKPSIVHALDFYDEVQNFLFQTLRMQNFALVPLVHQGNSVGLLILDNIVNHRKITEEDLDSIIPLANQAATAIENTNLYNQTQQMAITDGLTGLYNQRFFQSMIKKYLSIAKNKNLPLSVLILDIDYFKVYNDTNGHLAGNVVLEKLADLIRSIARAEDIPCRFGGEEFVVLFPFTSKEEAHVLGETLREKVEKTYFENQGAQPKGNLTVSMGLATYPIDKQNPDELLHAADLALYNAKDKGRNQLCLYEEGL